MKSLIIACLAAFISFAAFSQKAKQNTAISNSDTSRQSIYTCTMHPDYISFSSAKCPVCGNNMSKKEVMKAEVMKLYTCPMENVICKKPGKCPACGMDMVEYKPKSKSGNH
jgi:hypothetical protein